MMNEIENMISIVLSSARSDGDSMVPYSNSYSMQELGNFN